MKKMTAKISKKKLPEIAPELPIVEKTPLLEEHKEIPKKQKISLALLGFDSLTTLLKLRVVIITLFVLFTLAILLIFTNGYILSAVFLLISYGIIFIVLIKLFRIKKL